MKTKRTPQTYKGAALCAAAELGGIIGTIAQFDRKCNAAEHTDTGEVWEILAQIKDNARAAIRKIRRAEKQNAPAVVMTIEGGNFQGAMATEPIGVRVFDVDNLKAEGKTEKHRERIFARMTRGMRAVA